MPGRLGKLYWRRKCYWWFFFRILFNFFILYLQKKNILHLICFIAISLIIISFLIGERANFVKLFLAILILYFFNLQSEDLK